MLFKLAEESKDEVIGFQEAMNRPALIEDPRKGSPLKSEHPESTIIQNI